MSHVQGLIALRPGELDLPAELVELVHTLAQRYTAAVPSLWFFGQSARRCL
jgi:hypothetical protein